MSQFFCLGFNVNNPRDCDQFWILSHFFQTKKVTKNVQKGISIPLLNPLTDQRPAGPGSVTKNFVPTKNSIKKVFTNDKKYDIIQFA